MRLSEEYVLAKTRVSELSAVRSLNLWGNGVTDVSVRQPCRGEAAGLRVTGARADARRSQLVARMHNLEVLSLSVNRCGAGAPGSRRAAFALLRQRAICRRRCALTRRRGSLTSLRDFSGCTSLQELYLRKNEARPARARAHAAVAAPRPPGAASRRLARARAAPPAAARARSAARHAAARAAPAQRARRPPPAPRCALPPRAPFSRHGLRLPFRSLIQTRLLTLRKCATCAPAPRCACCGCATTPAPSAPTTAHGAL